MTRKYLIFGFTIQQHNIYGYTAQETLDIGQSLYEKHKILTYPRTDSKYLTSDIEQGLKGLLQEIKKGINTISPFIDKILLKGLNLGPKVIDDKKVSDHHAILVTNRISSYNPSNFSEKERNILKLVIVRMISAFSSPKRYLETQIEIDVNNYLFKNKFNNVIGLGYEEIINAFYKNKTTEDEISFNYRENDIVKLLNSEILKKKTSPKKRYTEATLLSTMENISRQIEDDDLKEYIKEKGLGTPATRAGIIEGLIKRNYIKREKKNLISTDHGRNLIKVVPEEIKSAETTALWEEKLLEIEKGSESGDAFINRIKENVSIIVNKNKFKAEDLGFAPKYKEVIEKCPKCGKNIYESSKSFYCEGFRDEPECDFSLWKDDKYFQVFGKKLNKTFVKRILKNNKAVLKGLKSKNGNIFDAEFSISSYDPFIKWEIKFLKK